MASATYNLAKEARDAAKAAQADAKSRYGAGSPQHRAAIADVQNTAKTMHAEKAAEGKSHAEAKEERDALVASTAGKSGKELFDIQTKIRAYGNVMREETGRQKGERTSYMGPGMRVRIDDEGRTVTQDGRVQYEVDPNAYARRFIPQYTPTQEQIDRGLTGGLLTPWQQTNIQNMLQYPGLLDQEDISGLTIEEQRNLGLFGEGIKEGRVPAAWRDAWRTQEWGDVKDPTTGLWTQADDARRAEAVADQLERYNMGAFNPTTGKLTLDDQGNIVGPRASWGPGTGILDPDDVYIDNPPVGGPGVGGPPNPTVPSFGYSQYQDWTRFMPTNFQLAEGGGMHYQPWATGLPVGGGSGPILTPPGGGGGTITGPGVINPNIWGTDTTTTNTNTGVIPGSDKANDLAAGRTHHPEMYDHNDMWIGAEGGGAREANWSGGGLSGGGAGGVPWQDTFMAPLGNKLGWNAAGTSAEARNFNAGNALTGFQNVGLLGDYPGFNAVTSPNVTRSVISDPGLRTHPDLMGNIMWDDPRYEGPLTPVNTIAHGLIEVEPELGAVEIESDIGFGPHG